MMKMIYILMASLSTMIFASQNQNYGMSQKEILKLSDDYIKNKNQINALNDEEWKHKPLALLYYMEPIALAHLYDLLKEMQKNEDTEIYNERIEENYN